MKYKYQGQETNYINGVRKWFPNKSLPAVLTEEILLSLGVETVEDVVSEPTLEEIKKRKTDEIVAQSNQLRNALRSGYSQGEIDTFAEQYSGALYLLGEGGTLEDSLFVQGLLSVRLNKIPSQSELTAFASLIKNNYTAAKEAMRDVLGTQQRLELAIRAATTENEVNKIVWIRD